MCDPVSAGMFAINAVGQVGEHQAQKQGVNARNRERLKQFDHENIDYLNSTLLVSQSKKWIEDKNYPELLISIIASMNGNLWQDIHPEHLNLILIGLAEYKQGLILNEILLEILQQSKII